MNEMVKVNLSFSERLEKKKNSICIASYEGHNRNMNHLALPVKLSTHSRRSTRWTSREDAAARLRPPEPSGASASGRSPTGSPRPRSASGPTAFLAGGEAHFK